MLPALVLTAALLMPLAAYAAEYTTVLPAQSRIGFEFTQMGVKIAGGFKRFDAELRFDPARPEAARAVIDIDLASIDAGSPEADEESAGRLWFDRARHPRARFVTQQVRALGNNRYELTGTLSLKGRSLPLTVPVTYTPGQATSTFDARFVLRRLDFGIGEGVWSNPRTVANEVPVSVRLVARRP